MVGELGLRQRLNLVGLLYTSTKNDPQALAQSLRALSELFRETDAKAFDEAFARHVGPLMDVPEGEKLDLAGIISTSMDLLRDAEERIAAFAKKHATYVAREALQQLPSLEEATNMWLRQVRKGRFEVKIDTSDVAPRMDELGAFVDLVRRTARHRREPNLRGRGGGHTAPKA